MSDLIEILFSFDTTGSMYPCLSQVRRVLKQSIERLFKDIPNLRISVLAHGDYCDKNRTYVTTFLNLSNNMTNITNFVMNIGPTGGGDSPECYEKVLRQARTEISWTPGSKKLIVIIGDDIPHPPHYNMNTEKIDWRKELDLLKEMGIQVYGVHAMPGIRRHSKPFYMEIANKTGGFYLTLEQFSDIMNLIMGVCYNQNNSLNQFNDEIERSGFMTVSLKKSFDALRGISIEKDYSEYDFEYEDPYFEKPKRTSYRDIRRVTKKSGEFKNLPEGLEIIPSGRFQVIPVDSTIDIKTFVSSQGIPFQKGRGFYELSKSVKVQQYKEIILMNKRTGEFFGGKEARLILGLKPQTASGGITERLPNIELSNWRVFIQSTSNNRKLIAGTTFLYEVID